MGWLKQLLGRFQCWTEGEHIRGQLNTPDGSVVFGCKRCGRPFFFLGAGQ
jgi:hypothetical protein